MVTGDMMLSLFLYKGLALEMNLFLSHGYFYLIFILFWCLPVCISGEAGAEGLVGGGGEGLGHMV